MSTEKASQEQVNSSASSELSQDDLPKEDLDDIEAQEEQEDVPQKDLNDM